MEMPIKLGNLINNGLARKHPKTGAIVKRIGETLRYNAPVVVYLDWGYL